MSQTHSGHYNKSLFSATFGNEYKSKKSKNTEEMYKDGLKIINMKRQRDECLLR